MEGNEFEVKNVAIKLVDTGNPLMSDESLTTPGAVARALGNMFKDYDREVVAIVNFDNKMRPINMNIVSIGPLNQSLFHPREILKSAILSNSSSVIMVHNHVTGDVKPSKADVIATDRMSKICELMDIPLLDHLIIGKEDLFYSFREENQLHSKDIYYEENVSTLKFDSFAYGETTNVVMEDEAGYGYVNEENVLKNCRDKLAQGHSTLSIINYMVCLGFDFEDIINSAEMIGLNKVNVVANIVGNYDRNQLSGNDVKVINSVIDYEKLRNLYYEDIQNAHSPQMLVWNLSGTDEWMRGLSYRDTSSILGWMYDSVKFSGNQRLFVDMDGTLAEFKKTSAIEELYEVGYFESLKPNENVLNAVKHIIDNYKNIDVYILSSYLTDSEYALDEKNKWLDEYLPELAWDRRVFVPCGENKVEAVPYGIRDDDYLLDDYTFNLIQWEEKARGIKALNGINHTNQSWQGDRININRASEDIAEDIRWSYDGKC